MRAHSFRPVGHPLALATALLLCLPLGSATAAAVASGTVSSRLAGSFAGGVGNFNLSGDEMWVGLNDPGSLVLDGGSLLRVGSLQLAQNGGRTVPASGTSTMLVTGAGTRLELDGNSNRLELAAWGTASLTVSAGATIDGRVNVAECRVGNMWCHTFIGNAAGSDASFTVTGAGSSVQLLRDFVVGGVAVFRPPIDGFTFGTPGGTTRGRVDVLDGGSLTTDNARIGVGPNNASALNSERSIADVTVRGAGSIWTVTGGSVESSAASFSTAQHRNAWATLNVSDGGKLVIAGLDSQINSVGLTTGGGRTDAVVSGNGSSVSFKALSGVFNVGRSLGSATLEVRDGGAVDHVWYGSVGRDGSFGTLTVDGNGSLYRANSTATAAANGGSTAAAVFDIGRNGGNGTVNVSNGARLEISATLASASGPQFSVGRDAASSGTLNIGSGGTVLVRAASVAAGSAEAFNPLVRIGRDGAGTLNVSGGGKLLVEGNAISTVANTRRTSLYIGGSSDTTAGGRGVASVSGVGSEIRVTGSDAYIGVGYGPLASGNLGVSDQASVTATILGIGASGGTGVARLDNARVNLSGQYTGNGEFGAALTVGTGSGAVGNFTASNGSSIVITTAAANGGGVSIGGSSTVDNGDGTLTLNASSLRLEIPANNSSVTVGRTGSGLLRLQNGSVADLGGNSLYVGRQAGSDGTLIATGSSVITAGFVGIGRNRVNGVDVNGGTATMVLNGATLNATDIIIGSNGYLGGSAGAIRASGSIVNYGIFSPGASPGLFSIDGNYRAGAGSRLILEVQASGAGFVTDEVRFGAGSVLDLAATAVEFRFLGVTDPRAFLNSGAFNMATFLRQAGADGTLAGLADAAYAGVTFSAQAEAYTFTSFSFSPAGGAVFTAVPVPEPASWLLLASGGAALLWRRRRLRG